jgi:S1-C subfamily serine protease
MTRKLLVAAFAATLALSAAATAQEQPPLPKFPPVKLPQPPVQKPPTKKPPMQQLVPGVPSDPISDHGLGVTGYVLPGQGYVISSVRRGPARRVGLEAGDIIKSVDGVAITTEARWTLAMKGKERVTLRILDGRDPTAPLATKSVNLK